MIHLFVLIHYHIFYISSKVYKKYDKYYHVGDTYYIGGSVIIGFTFGLFIINNLSIISAFFSPTPIWIAAKILAAIPPLTGYVMAFIFHHKKFHEVVWNRMSSMEILKRKALAKLSVIYLVITFVFFFNTASIVKWIFSLNH